MAGNMNIGASQQGPGWDIGASQTAPPAVGWTSGGKVKNIISILIMIGMQWLNIKR